MIFNNYIMFSRRAAVFFLIALLLSSIPAMGQEKSAEALSAEEQIINNIKGMWAAVEERDLEGYLAYIHPDYSVFGEGDVYLHRGKDKERIDYADYLSRAAGVRTFMHDPNVTINGNMAFITYYWNDAGYLKGERFTSRGKSTRIFVKENEQWLCIHSHFTAVP